MKHAYKYLWLVFAFFGLSLNWWSDSAFDVMNFPKITEFVEDYSHILTSTDLADLRNQAKNHEKNTSEQAVTILFPNRGWYELADIGLKVFRDNGIGQKNTNNWILLLIATEEKKIRIITGYGMDSKVPDILAKKWIEEDIRPKVNSWDYAWAISAFYRKINSMSSSEALSEPVLNNSGSFGFFTFLLGIIWVIFGFYTRFHKEKLSFFLKYIVFSWVITAWIWIILVSSDVFMWGLAIIMGFVFWLIAKPWRWWGSSGWWFWGGGGGGFSGRWGSSGWGWAWN